MDLLPEIWVYDFQTVKEGSDLRFLPDPAKVAPRPGHEEIRDLTPALGIVGDGVRDREVAPRSGAVHGPADQAPWVAGIGDEVQEAEVQHRNWFIEVNEPRGVGVAEDEVYVAGIFQDEGGALVLSEQRADLWVTQDDGVAVDVDNARARVGRGRSCTCGRRLRWWCRGRGSRPLYASFALIPLLVGAESR